MALTTPMLAFHLAQIDTFVLFLFDFSKKFLYKTHQLHRLLSSVSSSVSVEEHVSLLTKADWMTLTESSDALALHVATLSKDEVVEDVLMVRLLLG